MNDIKIGGLYRHFKGNEYTVIGIGEHTETNEEFVIYQDIQSGKIWIRPKEMFLEEVDKPGYNYKGPRFTFVK